MIKNKFIEINQEKFGKLDPIRTYLINNSETEKLFADDDYYHNIMTFDGPYAVFKVNRDLYSDAEIFFSQFYSYFGFEVPIYFRVNIDGEDYLACNNIVDYGRNQEKFFEYKLSNLNNCELNNRVVLVDTFHKNIRSSFAKLDETLLLDKAYNAFYERKYFRGNVTSTLYNLYLDSMLRVEKDDLRNYFLTKAIKDKIKMRILDCAMYNNARNPYNFAYKFSWEDGTSYVSSCIPLTSMNSAQNVSYIQDGLNKKVSKRYFSETKRVYTTKANLIKETKNNELLKRYFDNKERNEFAKQLSEVTNYDIVKDVKENIGYEINSDYQKTIYDNCKLISSQLMDDDYVM